MFSIFSLSIQLSESGLANWIAVVFHLCRYIDLLKSDGVQEWIFQELKQIAQVGFGIHALSFLIVCSGGYGSHSLSKGLEVYAQYVCI